jgi:hypothetical protein
MATSGGSAAGGRESDADVDADPDPDPDPDGGATPRAAVGPDVDVEVEVDADADEEPRSRKWAILAVLPFLAIGLADVLLLLYWGIEPLWGFAILPPILFCTVLAWIVFSTDFLEGRT